MIGQTLGHYKIETQLGAGGMGVVYRATDSKLGRQVAIKVLPENFAHDPERLARFEREARLLAALNHPNIAAIHGLEEAGGVHYLVLELVPGKTLEGPLPVEEALQVCRQIAEALEAAHEKGIIHRDLKPANIKITPEGKVKVLDFGLAKAMQGEASSVDLSQSPTMSAGTGAGVVMGTAGYMSPEQARGAHVGKRADIWAFGCVLFEVLAGQRAFPGETLSDCVAAVLTKEPEWSALPAAAPPQVERLLRRCLQKDPQKRLHDIGDARLELEEPAREEPSRRPRVSLFPRLAVATGLLLGALATILVARSVWPGGPPSPRIVRFSVPFAPDRVINPTHSPEVAISPDGSKVAYQGVRAGNMEIYLRSLDRPEAKHLKQLAGGMPFFSPDGQSLGLWCMYHTLRKVALPDGAPVAIAPAEAMAGASWGEDGNIVYAWFDLFTIPASGGASKTLLKVDLGKGERFYRLPQHLPGARAVLFTIGTADTETFDDGRIAALDLKTGQKKIILEGGSCARYSPTGHLIYARGGSLLAVPFDAKKLTVTGPPFPVGFEGVFSSLNTGMAAFSISTTGDLVYASGPTEGGRRLPVWVDRAGVAKPFNLPPRSYLHPRFSPDDKQLAIEIEGPTHDFYTYSLERGTLTRLSLDGASHWPFFTPKGDRITFRSWRTGSMTMWWMPADRSGPEERLEAPHADMQSPETWSPDGRAMAYVQMGRPPKTDFDIWVLPGLGGAPGDRKPRLLLQTKFSEASPKFSPDGRWLAYCSNESGRLEVYVMEVTAGYGSGAKVQVSTDGGTDPVWRRQGGELFYREGDKMMVVSVTTQPKLTLSKPRQLWEQRFLHGSGASCGMAGVASANYDVTADGQRFVMIEDKDQGAVARQVNVVLGFGELVKRAEQAQRNP